jgi:hypothetical protein
MNEEVQTVLKAVMEAQTVVAQYRQPRGLTNTAAMMKLVGILESEVLVSALDRLGVKPDSNVLPFGAPKTAPE